MKKRRRTDLPKSLKPASESPPSPVSSRSNDTMDTLVRELRQLDRMKSEFISTVSHELRTPLTSIGGYVKLISTGDAGPVTDTQKEFLSIIEVNVERLTDLINDILDLEKLESGKFNLVKGPQDLRSVLRECRESLLLMAHRKGLELRLNLPERVLPVLGDRARLIQVFNNLISNAIKYTDSGFVEVEVESKKFAVVVRVRDSGIGISAEDQEKLFQKFFRTDSSLASRVKGTGLGLVIVRGLVEAHGGSVSVQSQSGAGSTFTVSFPVADAVGPVQREEVVRAIEEVHAARQEDANPVPEALWIVDPDEEDAQEIRRIVEKGSLSLPGRNFKPRWFKKLDHVPQLSEGELPPAIVIIDPASIGGEVQSLSVLRKKLRGSVPMLVVSESVDTAAAFAEGASALITKPIGERELWIAVKDLLQSRGLRVLVAEANTDFRILLKRALEQRGFEVEDVDHGKLVMGKLDHGHYDLLLIDVSLPDVSGVELLKAIRKQSAFDSIFVFLMSEGPDDPSVLTGNSAFVAKDRGIDGILERVSSEIEKLETAESI